MNFGSDEMTIIIVGIMLFFVALVCLGYVMQGLLLQTIAKAQGRDDGIFAWIPILNNYLLIKLAGGHEMALALYVLGFIPVVGMIFSWTFLIYICYLSYKLLTRYGVNGVMIIVGFFIFPVLFICYYQAYKNVKNNNHNKI